MEPFETEIQKTNRNYKHFFMFYFLPRTHSDQIPKSHRNQIPHIFSVFQALPRTCLSEKGKVKRRKIWSQILQKVIYLPLSWAITRSLRNVVRVKSWIHHENIRRRATTEFMQEVTIMLQHLVCSQGYFQFLMKL